MRMRTFVSAAVLATTALVPTVGITAPAEAVSGKTWNRLAQCESSGRWHINTHNGYYGGLQISKPTWRGYGGRKFAKLPNHASRAQQIKVAEKIKKHQGWGAWPTCSARIGKG